MIHKEITARRFEKRRHIAHKLYLEKVVFKFSDSFLKSQPQGYLDKGKIDVLVFKTKSTKDRGVNTNSVRNYPARDLRNIARLEYSMAEYISDR